MAKTSMEQIIKHGEVKRGQIGVGIQDITPDLREAFEIDNGQGGVLITNVMPDSPAEDAGLKTGDVIIAVDDKKISSSGQLRSKIGMKTIGDEISLTVLRDGKEARFKIKIGKPTSLANLNGKIHQLLAGVQLENEPNGEGVRVSSIAPNSSAAYSGLRRDDVIVAANKRRVYDLQTLESALARSKSSALLQVNRGNGSLFIVIR